MLDKFVADIYVKSIFDINYKKLKKNGIKCILFDLDNTISPINIKKPNNKTKELFEEIKGLNIRPIIFSNSSKSIVEPFKNSLISDSCSNCAKPSKNRYLKVMKTFNLKPEELAAVGDQLLTDVYGANRLGITSILVNPISRIDRFTTYFNRFVEKFIYKRLKKKDLFLRGRYYD